MTQATASMIRGARAAANHIANRETRFIDDEWYVIARTDEVGRDLLRRTVLGKTIVLFRSLDGSPIAFDNRCPHRSFPLSSGTLDGDSVVCGYHGMRFDLQGNCIDLPSLPRCPKGVGVRRYPLVELGPYCWIWMGDPSIADAGAIPHLSWIGSPEWTGGQGYFHMKASYVSLHENLLDTSHLSFIHANTIGSPEYVKAPATTEIGDGKFALDRVIRPAHLPEALALLTGLGGRPDIARAVRNEFLSPALYQATTRIYDASHGEADRTEFVIRAAHMTTPETATSTHYFVHIGRNFAPQDSASREAMVARFMQAFEEDVVALELQDEMQTEAGADLYELSFPSDELTLAMRRYLKTRAAGSADQAGAAKTAVAGDGAAV